MRAYAWLLGLLLLVVAGPAAAQQLRDLSAMSSVEIKALQQRLTADACYQGAIDGQTSQALTDSIKVCPSQDPILRIETGMHTARIREIDVDHACHIAATGSYDKTVRVWSLPDGHLLRTLRVPIGTGSDGMIYATAVSPDGRWIAAGGWDVQRAATYQSFVYVFDSTSGRMVARVGPFGNAIAYLVFSPDGRWLAATSGPNVGLKVIDTATWRVATEDKDYADTSWGAGFAPDGRLYTVADDGRLRGYAAGPSFRKEREIRAHGGKQPHSIAVDPFREAARSGLQ